MNTKKGKWLCGVAAFCLLLVALSSIPSQTENKYTIEPRTYAIGGGSSSGAYYMQSTPIATIWEGMEYATSCTVQATNGAFENLLLISEGSVDAGLGDAFCYYQAMEGADPYDKEYPNAMALCAGMPLAAYFIVKAESDIHSLSDIVGHTLGTGTIGSGAEYEIRHVLEALGIRYADLARVEHLGAGSAFTAFQDGRLDVVAFMLTSPSAAVVEASTLNNIRIISLTNDERETLLAKLPWLVEAEIPGGTYRGIAEPVAAVAVPIAMFVNKDIPGDVAYEMSRIIHENVGMLKGSNAAFSQWSFGLGCTGNIPLHPGSERYYNTVLPKNELAAKERSALGHAQ